MSVFEDVVCSLKNNLSDLFKTEADDLLNLIIKDGSNFAIEQQKDLEQYTQQFLTNQISKNELGFLIKGKKDLLEMKGLTDLGLSQIKMQEIKDKVILAIISSILSIKI